MENRLVAAPEGHLKTAQRFIAGLRRLNAMLRPGRDVLVECLVGIPLARDCVKGSYAMSKITRRRFIGSSVGGVAAIGAAATQSGLPAVQAGSPANKVVLAIIGARGRGMDVIVKMLQIPDVAVKYVCDPEEARGKSAVKQIEKIQHSAPTHVTDM